MSWALAVCAAGLAAIGTWLAMDRTLTRILLGLSLWGHAAVLLLLVEGGRPGAVPIGSADELAGAEVSDPLVQALALTVIVITFAVTAFLLALATRSWTLTGDDRVQDDPEDVRLAGQEGDEDLPPPVSDSPDSEHLQAPAPEPATGTGAAGGGHEAAGGDSGGDR